MQPKININTAPPKQLTQLPGIAKNLAYRIVAHRDRHGLFTHGHELLEVKDFPAETLDDIKKRAPLTIPGEVEQGTSPRRLRAEDIERTRKKTRGYTEEIRTTRRADRLKPTV